MPQVSVFVVNLKGRPFMGGLSENRPLLYSLAATFALTFMSASETIPRVSKHCKRNRYICNVVIQDLKNWVVNQK